MLSTLGKGRGISTNQHQNHMVQSFDFSCIVYITDRWLSNIDKGLVTGVVFIDLRKAFDTVDINILFLKLTRYGISGSERKWFESYLTDRTQSVSVDGQSSDPLTVTIGVLQGPILGPLLFFCI